MASIRHDWYQTDQKVVIDVLLKNAAERNVNVAIQSDAVIITGDDDLCLEFILQHTINAARSTFKISKVKIEISLQKLTGERWTALVKSADEKAASVPCPMLNPVSSENQTETTAKPKDHKDWDRLVKDLVVKENIDQNEADPLNDLFRKIYSDSPPEIQRAMNKSFTESGGTVLSTNWKEVGSQKVDMKPPEGTEFRSWED